MDSFRQRTTRSYHLDAATEDSKVWDVVVIGGGATGAGITLDAATRGYSALLLEGSDFAKGTSSRSTKLIHGGVRYLQQFQFGMVRDSLRERGRLLRNAPHLVHELEFVIPCKSMFDRVFYGAGLKLYDALAWGAGARLSKQVSRRGLYDRFPQLGAKRFAGGVSYIDAQFNDSRLVMEIIRTAVESNAIVLNHAKVISLDRNANQRLQGLEWVDRETGKTHKIRAKAIVNATGPFCDAIRRMDDDEIEPLVAASQGVHVVLPTSLFESKRAIIVPKTSDGRVLFIIPWQGHVLVGTTDTPIRDIVEEPKAQREEVDFLLETLANYLEFAPSRSDVLSVFTGIRPLVKARKDQPTKQLSRDHTIEVSRSGLVTITGGKWTTYRKMAEDCVDLLSSHFDLPKSSCQTKSMLLQQTQLDRVACEQELGIGNNRLISLQPKLDLTEADLLQGIRFEYARTLEDLLARRTRALFLNTSTAVQIAPIAVRLLAKELRKEEAWESDQLRQFTSLAQTYML
jgi:glycerol-3-phosphate dehydrogenase